MEKKLRKNKLFVSAATEKKNMTSESIENSKPIHSVFHLTHMGVFEKFL
jgi:hypothetical protein